MIYKIKDQKSATHQRNGENKDDHKDSKDESIRDSFYQNNEQSLNSARSDEVDGAQDSIDIKYMNHTFFEMFLERLQSRTDSTSQMFLNNFKE